MSKVDWPRVMADLKSAGYSLRMLQSELGLGKDHLHNVARGQEPLHSEGVALLDLLKRSQENYASVCLERPKEDAIVIEAAP